MVVSVTLQQDALHLLTEEDYKFVKRNFINPSPLPKDIAELAEAKEKQAVFWLGSGMKWLSF